MTQYSAATSLCPSGYDGTGLSAALGLLAVAYGYAIELPPTIWPRASVTRLAPLAQRFPN